MEEKIEEKVIEAEINEYLTLKLFDNIIKIYVNGEVFTQCRYLLIVDPLNLEEKDDSTSIDEIIKMDEVRMVHGFRFRPNIETFGGVAMRFAEWFYATKFIETELDNGDIFVRDGSLQTGYKDEILLVRDLHSLAQEKNVYITGLSKSCRLITKNGDSLISLIDMIAREKYPQEKW